MRVACHSHPLPPCTIAKQRKAALFAVTRSGQISLYKKFHLEKGLFLWEMLDFPSYERYTPRNRFRKRSRNRFRE